VSVDVARAGQNCLRCGTVNEPNARFCSACGGALLHSMPPTERAPSHLRTPSQPPTRAPHRADPLLGLVVAERYRVLEFLGRGGMGVVYKAEHSRIGKVLALKLLTGELTRDVEQVARFKREAEMASRLSHPNTVQVFDFGGADGLAYLAMEYVRGEDLGHIVNASGPMPGERMAKIMVQICSSLGEAHDKGIIHRDLKPENIMVVKGPSGEDVVKVLDFGLAKLRESSELSELTLNGAIIGTPYYMSPEQIRGEALGPQSDVYALGAMMYAVLTGELVFDAPTPMGVLTKHLTEEPIPPSRRVPELSRGLEQIVLLALSKDPARRFPSVNVMQEALLDELGGRTASSVQLLLDSRKLKKLAGGDEDAATRDEVERYERKLARRGRLAWALGAARASAAAFFAYRLYATLTAPPEFQGRELEPNDTASSALALPFPLEVRGHLGKRLDRERSDRDFYRVTVPQGTSAVHLKLEPLPNIALCAWLYAAGRDDPFGRYCPGAAGLALDVPVLALDAGDYVLAVMQDRDRYEDAPAPPVHENVSDEYRLMLTAASAAPSRETEPNDAAPLGNTLAPGASLRGRLAWSRDKDLVCADKSARRSRFVIEDAVEKPRARGAALQITPTHGAGRGVPVRIHRTGASVPASPRDVVGAYRTAWVDLGADGPPCVELELVVNPWSPPPQPILPPPGHEEYVVRLEVE
jgi:tRNA A-37 threonylcarbamoyl transferase component Bud32